MQTELSSASAPVKPRSSVAAAWLECGPIHLPYGLPGFADLRDCHLEPLGGFSEDFFLLRARKPEGPRFILAPLRDPGQLFSSETMGALLMACGLPEAALRVLLVVTLVPAGHGLEALVNLRAPLVVDVRLRTARQIVLPDPKLPLRCPLGRRTT